MATTPVTSKGQATVSEVQRLQLGIRQGSRIGSSYVGDPGRNAGQELTVGRSRQCARRSQESARSGANRLRSRRFAQSHAQAMIGLDTHSLARCCIDDDADAPAQRQCLSTRRHIEPQQPLMVSESENFELKCVMRGYCGSAQAEVASVMRHLLEQAHITVEDRDAVEQALSNAEAGIDFADALHHAGYKACASVATFDDRKFARRAKKLGLAPAVMVVS